MSNTGIKNISWDEQSKRYRIRMCCNNKKRSAVATTLEDAKVEKYKMFQLIWQNKW